MKEKLKNEWKQRQKSQKPEQEQAWTKIGNNSHVKVSVDNRKQKLSEEDIIMRDYDVKFYMKRGLTKTEAINYIKNKLTVKTLWSKMSKCH